MKFISTAGHGFLSVTPNQLKKAMGLGFKPTCYSFVNKSSVLLEEDCDAGAFMDAMYGEGRGAKWQTIKSTYQNDINRNKYSSTPETLAELEEILKVYDTSNFKVGDILTTTNGVTETIVGQQKNGYIYYDKEEGRHYCMPFQRIAKIEQVFEEVA